MQLPFPVSFLVMDEGQITGQDQRSHEDADAQHLVGDAPERESCWHVEKETRCRFGTQELILLYFTSARPQDEKNT